MEKLKDLGIPTDLILPSQWPNPNKLSPEGRLILAILEDAVSCFMDYYFASRKPYQRLAREAEEWIFGSSPAWWFFSFDNICEILELNPETMRMGLKRLIEERKLKFEAEGRKVECRHCKVRMIPIVETRQDGSLVGICSNCGWYLWLRRLKTEGQR